MAEPITIKDDGFQAFDIGGCKFTVDLVNVYNKISSIQEQHKDGKGSDIPYYQELVKELGGPVCSGAAATLFVNHVIEEAKKVELFMLPKQSSAPSTDSTASTPESPPTSSV